MNRQLEQARYYWIVTVRRDGRPHAGPVWGVWLAGALYWAMSPETAMAKNVARCPRALVHLESARDVVIVEGAVDCLNAPMLPTGVVDAYQVKYDSRQEAGDRGMPYYVLVWREGTVPPSPARRPAWCSSDEGGCTRAPDSVG